MPIQAQEVEERSQRMNNLKGGFPIYLSKNLKPGEAYKESELYPFLYAFLTEERFFIKKGRKPTDEPGGIWWMMEGPNFLYEFMRSVNESKLINRKEIIGEGTYYYLASKKNP